MKNKWSMFGILFFCAITVAISQLKVPPIMGMISDSMNISLSQASWLMSIFTVAGIILAIPSATIMNKLGPKKLLLSLMMSLLIGNVLGGLTNHYSVLLISRAIEGIAFAMIILVGVAMIKGWFGEKAGSAMGMFNTFAALGSFVMMNVGLSITSSLGLKSLWFITAGMSVICFILVWFFIQVPEEEHEDNKQEKPSLIEAMKNSRLWSVALARGCVAFVLFTFVTTYPQLFMGFYGLDAGTANFYAGLNGLFGIPCCILCGIIVDKTGKPLLTALLGFIGLIGTSYMATILGPSTYILHTLLVAIFGGFTITALFCIAPAIAKKPSLIGYTVAIMNLFYYIGVFACGPVILGTAEQASWQVATYILMGISLVGVLLVLGLMISPKKKSH